MVPQETPKTPLYPAEELSGSSWGRSYFIGIDRGQEIFYNYHTAKTG
ncbi:hypothetical protein CLOM621_05844 [Clostridium sp. M62/1]|nr:hypothetical protein CLOM621_05844 [Clostridium sp. M62/1]